MSHYDHIPAGKKVEYNEKTGQHDLVDLKEDSVEDLQILLEELRQTVKTLELELKKFSGAVVPKKK
jgi:hypothetical protein